MNNIAIATQTIEITSTGFYMLDARKIELLPLRFDAVEVFSPEKGKLLADT